MLNENSRPVVVRYYMSLRPGSPWQQISASYYHATVWSFETTLIEGMRVAKKYDPAETAVPGEDIYWLCDDVKDDIQPDNANVGQ
jgi:hypothetical protein